MDSGVHVRAADRFPSAPARSGSERARSRPTFGGRTVATDQIGLDCPLLSWRGIMGIVLLHARVCKFALALAAESVRRAHHVRLVCGRRGLVGHDVLYEGLGRSEDGRARHPAILGWTARRLD